MFAGARCLTACPRAGIMALGAVLGLLMGLSGCAGCSALADTIRLRADQWCPYNCDPGSDQPGLLIELALVVLGAAGHTVEYALMPWPRVLDEVRAGRIDGAVGALPSEAPDLVYGSEPLALDETAVAVRRGQRFTYDGPASLDPYRIGIIKDYNYDGGELDQYILRNSKDTRRIQAITGDNAGGANLRKLLSGRVDVVIDSVFVLNYLVSGLKAFDKIEIFPLQHTTEVHIGFTPANPKARAWADALVAGVQVLRQNGEYARILARYRVGHHP